MWVNLIWFEIDSMRFLCFLIQPITNTLVNALYCNSLWFFSVHSLFLTQRLHGLALEITCIPSANCLFCRFSSSRSCRTTPRDCLTLFHNLIKAYSISTPPLMFIVYISALRKCNGFNIFIFIFNFSPNYVLQF